MRSSRIPVLALAGAAMVAGCEPRDEPAAGMEGEPAATADAQDVWWDRVQELCGQSFAGAMVRYDEAMDQGWLDRDVIMHVRDCTETEIRIPLHVGENRSRTWMLTRTDDGIQLEHDHRYPDGTEEVMSRYGGHTVDAGSPTRQEFPANEYSRQLFLANDHPDGVENVWIMEIHPGERFVYNLTRFNRDFAAEFDLTRPVETPPPTWAIEPRPEAGS